MNETLLWIVYCASGTLAFAVAYYGRWRPILAVIAGGLLTGAGWALLYKLTDEEKRPDWIRVDLSLNLTFGLIFATAGTTVGWWMLAKRQRADD